MFLIPLKRVSADNANAELMDRRAEFTELQKKKKKKASYREWFVWVYFIISSGFVWGFFLTGK